MLGPWTVTLNYEDEDLDGAFVEFGDECEKDDRWTFLSDHTLRQDYGSILCNPDDDPNLIVSSAWELLNNDEELMIQYGFDDLRFKIASIDNAEIVMNIIEPDAPANTFKYRVVLQR